MDWAQVFEDVLTRVSLGLVVALAINLVQAAFPLTLSRQEGSTTIFPISFGWKAFAGLAGLVAAVALWQSRDDGAWAWIAIIFTGYLLTIPGEIVFDPHGVSQRRIWLIPGWRRVLPWDSIDSAHEELTPVGHGLISALATVSAGPDRTIHFSNYHSDLEGFLSRLELQGVPVGRISYM